MMVPVLESGRVIGAISFVIATLDRRYDDDDLTVAVEIAARASRAIDRAE